jgi:2',3'-cyclic-nucleotide 2'-phosphodiesterase (5'-nucleotidase family)
MAGVDSTQEPSVAAEQARARLHEEIERVRTGVEEMLAEQGSDDAGLRRELDAMREETRAYVKKRVGKAEKRMEKRLDKIDAKAQKLERKIDQVEQDRKYAEWRIHTNTEQMLDGLLKEVRAIADLLTRSR